jgi:DNA-binding CsgD family transcriptional regulator
MTPRIAIIGNNTLQAMGLKSVLSEIIPIAEVCAYSTLEDMERAGADSFFHYFVSAQVVLINPDFFISHRHKTIVLVSQPSAIQQFANFHTLDICQPEYKLIKSILLLHQTSHHGGHDHAFIPPRGESSCALMEISQREAEVLALVVKGYINKEIADKLNISLATVVSHRKNITDKLRIKSVSALTIYAVTHGIVSVDEI